MAILPRGFAPQTNADCYCTGGKHNHGVNFSAKTHKLGPAQRRKLQRLSAKCIHLKQEEAGSARSFEQSEPVLIL